MLGRSMLMAASNAGPTDPYWANVALLLQPVAGGSIVDLSSSPKSITVNGDTQISTALGDPTLLFDGSADYLGIANNNAFDTNQAFTLEILFYRLTTANAMFFLRSGGTENWNPSDGHQIIVYITGSSLNTQLYTGGLNVITLSASAPSVNTLHYLSVGYNGTTVEVHLNQNRIGSATTTLSVPTTRNIIEIGRYFGSSAFDFNGHIRALRWTTGVQRNSGATITVPSLPFPTQ